MIKKRNERNEIKIMHNKQGRSVDGDAEGDRRGKRDMDTCI